MKKAVISNRIFMSVDPELKAKIDKDLTYSVPSYNPNDPPFIIKNMSTIRDNLIAIPSGRYDLIPEDYEIVDKRLKVPAEFPEFRFDLMQAQADVYDDISDSCIINAWTSWGKAQPYYSKIRVPNGWTTMGDIQVGDTLVTPNNTYSRVINKFHHINKEIYRITLADGRYTDACAEHLWDFYVKDRRSKKPVTTLQLLEGIKQGHRISLPLTSTIINKSKNDFIIHPYVLGILLGDGSISTNGISISSADEFIIDKVNSLLPVGHSLKYSSGYDYRVTSDYVPGSSRENLILNELRRLNLIGTRSHTKFIPDEYKFMGMEDTLSLIQGLMDSDGSVEVTGGSSEFSSTSRQLMEDFCDLIYSLGGSANIQTRHTSYSYKGEKKEGKESYRVRPSRLSFDIKSKLFSLPRKSERLIPNRLDNVRYIRIESIEFLNTQNCYCIEIDSEDKLYLTDNYIVTHNTFTALAIAAKLGQKTLVVTHTVALRDQWVEEARKVFGITPGIIGSGKLDLNGPLVIGNTQTLYKNLDILRKAFGTLILDEMHHVSSPTFSKIIDSSHARYKIGLSGTIERKDGKHVVFRDYFGPKVYQPAKDNYITPEIHIHKFDIRFSDSKAPWANKVTELSTDPDYRKSVALLATYYASKGHKVLVVADRVEFLKACAHLCGERAICVTGGQDGVRHDLRAGLIDQLDDSKDILCGTQSIFSEGFSKKNLSCLILATPVNNEPLLTQLIGRVIRKMEGKQQPVVVDINLKGSTVQRQAMNRIGYYMKQGYNITYM